MNIILPAIFVALLAWIINGIGLVPQWWQALLIAAALYAVIRFIFR